MSGVAKQSKIIHILLCHRPHCASNPIQYSIFFEFNRKHGNFQTFVLAFLGVRHLASDAGGGLGGHARDEEDHQDGLFERGQGGPVCSEHGTKRRMNEVA